MYYAVRKGHTRGIFDNWPEAQAATSGFSGPEYKKFKTREEAKANLDNRDYHYFQITEIAILGIFSSVSFAIEAIK